MSDLLARVVAHPVSAGCILLAAFIYFFAGEAGIELVFLDARVFEGEPWRALTTAFVHGGFWGDESATMGALHLGFNAMWLWILGAELERHWGHFRYAAFIILVATPSSLAEYAFLYTPVGLSGVVYGLLTARWWMDKRRPGVLTPIPPRTVQFLAFWFFFSIAMSMSDTLPVANIAHGLGALIGWLLTCFAIGALRDRLVTATLAMALVAGSVLVAGPFRPQVNLASLGAVDEMALGMQALSAGDYAEAERRFGRATTYRHCPPETWFNLGLVRVRQGDFERAAEAFAVASELAPGQSDFARARDQARAEAARRRALAPQGR